jgi:putative transposon-encoded protein
MKAVITRIESVVTPSGNSSHVVVPKAWIGKEAIVALKEGRGKKEKMNRAVLESKLFILHSDRITSLRSKKYFY